MSSAAYGLSGGPLAPILDEIDARLEEISAHPFATSPEKSFGLLLRQSIDRNTAAKNFMRDRGMPGFIRTQLQGGFGLTADSEKSDIEYFVGDTKICRYHAVMHQLPNGLPLMLGQLPGVDQNAVPPSADWDDFEQVWGIVADAFEEDIMLADKSQCYAAKNGGLLPVWQVRVLVGDRELPWLIDADAHEVLRKTREFFDLATVRGTTKVFRNNPLDKEVITVSLPNLTGDSTLSSQFIRTVVPANYAKAKNTDHQFIYSVEQDEYKEAAAYTYAQLHFDFVKELGFVWYGSDRAMDIMLHQTPNGQVNNALFVPAAGANSAPRIEIGDGDGRALKGLAMDSDVVSHEFGHHVVYQTLKDTESESLALHEGMADFFAFARSQDPCLGESICPANSEACWVKGQCLRTAENTLRYNDSRFRTLGGHFQGQLISGLLWGLRKNNTVPPENLNKLAYTAVTLFPRQANFRHFLLALLYADQKLFQSSYRVAILNMAGEKGMAELVDDIDESSTVPLPSSDTRVLTGGNPIPGESSTKSSKSDGGISCGRIGTYNGKIDLIFGLLVVLLPLAMPVLAVRRIKK